MLSGLKGPSQSVISFTVLREVISSSFWTVAVPIVDFRSASYCLWGQSEQVVSHAHGWWLSQFLCCVRSSCISTLDIDWQVDVRGVAAPYWRSAILYQMRGGNIKSKGLLDQCHTRLLRFLAWQNTTSSMDTDQLSVYGCIAGEAPINAGTFWINRLTRSHGYDFFDP